MGAGRVDEGRSARRRGTDRVQLWARARTWKCRVLNITVGRFYLDKVDDLSLTGRPGRRVSHRGGFHLPHGDDPLTPSAWASFYLDWGIRGRRNTLRMNSQRNNGERLGRGGAHDLNQGE